MNKRGRPPHPDILTPREWEVLEHIRKGRSNEEIAERLGISVNGVKYHVSEILSKLHLENRTDAARWAASDAREARRWWTAAAAPLLFWRKLSFGWLSPVLAVGLAAGVAAGIGVLVWALVETRGNGNQLEGLTVEELTSRVREAITKDGHVFHTFIELDSSVPDGETQPVWTIEVWWDTSRDVRRDEFKRDPSWEADIAEYTVTIVAGDSSYVSDGDEAWKGPGERCEGTTSVLSVFPVSVMGCEQFGEGADVSPVRLETGAEYRGTAAVTVVQEGSAESEEPEGTKTTEFTVKQYVDRDTFLPLALVMQTRSPAGDRTGEVVISFENDFVPADSLPADFFDPASIGYVEEMPIGGSTTP